MAADLTCQINSETKQQPLNKCQNLVDNLYNFRDTYFESHHIDQANQKQKDVAQELEDVLQKMEELKVAGVANEPSNRSVYLFLRGRALNVLPEYSESCLDLLEKAVKLDPKMVDAWNELGECYWKKGDVKSARDCFDRALKHKTNKISLRSLSMVLRQLGQDRSEKLENITKSVEKAREAVQLDVTDGTSWCILGNAYLTMFFSIEQNPQFLKQSMTAYRQAEKDTITNSNPDLHYNRAIVLKYEEEYQEALKGFCQASALDPSWNEPQEKEQALLKYLTTVQDLIEKKGKLKAKKLHSLLEDLNGLHLGPYDGGSYTSPQGGKIHLDHIPLNGLSVGLNLHKVVLGKVVCSTSTEDPVPFTFCVVDHSKECWSVTVYNLAQGKGVIIGDSVAIPEPYVQEVKFKYNNMEFNFKNIRVETPVVLVVNGKKLGADKQALAEIAVSFLAS